MIDRNHDLPLTRQAQILGLSRSSLYYVPVEISAADLELMRRMQRTRYSASMGFLYLLRSSIE